MDNLPEKSPRRKSGCSLFSDLPEHAYPYGLTRGQFAAAVREAEEYFDMLGGVARAAGVSRLEDTLSTPATLSAVVSDVFERSLVKMAPQLVVNQAHNGHPDTVPLGLFPGNKVAAGDQGVEVKASVNNVSDAHGAHTGWWCQVVYGAPANENNEKRFEVLRVHLAHLNADDDFRANARKTLVGTRTATPNGRALAKLRSGVVYIRAGAAS